MKEHRAEAAMRGSTCAIDCQRKLATAQVCKAAVKASSGFLTVPPPSGETSGRTRSITDLGDMELFLNFLRREVALKAHSLLGFLTVPPPLGEKPG
ncbi:hypothetical protein FKM82_025324 [Ascaphus truei]